MKRFLFYIQIIPWIAGLSVPGDFILLHWIAYMIIVFGAFILSIVTFSLCSNEEIEEWSGYNLFCKILHIDNDLD